MLKRLYLSFDLYAHKVPFPMVLWWSQISDLSILI